MLPAACSDAASGQSDLLDETTNVGQDKMDQITALLFHSWTLQRSPGTSLPFMMFCFMLSLCFQCGGEGSNGAPGEAVQQNLPQSRTLHCLLRPPEQRDGEGDAFFHPHEILILSQV